jgi:hypothetical protein
MYILRPYLVLRYFIPERWDMRGFGALKYSSPKILYHDREFLIWPKIH